MENSPAMTVFDVSPHVEPATKLLREIPASQALKSLLGLDADSFYFDSTNQEDPRTKRKLEACSLQDQKMVFDVAFHPLVNAIHLAFDQHRPLCLSPDMIWLLIAQGLANHINANAEQLRSQFVEHQGKLKLQLRRDDFVKGLAQNPWPEVFSGFSAAIREHIGETTHTLLMPDFSTTGKVEKAVTEIVLLDVMQSYFNYELQSFCGIPQIKLEGTLADWQMLLERTKDLAKFQLEWWIDILIPILEQFIKAVDGTEPNQCFWQSMYKYRSMSGGDHITGWITAFFPYLKESEEKPAAERNESLVMIKAMLEDVLFLDADTDFDFNKEQELDPDEWPSYDDGFHATQLPLGLSVAPFRWVYLDTATSDITTYEMEFLGGFVGVKQDSHDYFLRPEIGWAICEVSSRNAKKTHATHNTGINKNSAQSWFNSFRSWFHRE